MSKVAFSAELFEQLGGVNWVCRSKGFEFRRSVDQSLVEKEVEETLVKESKEHDVATGEVSNPVMSDQNDMDVAVSKDTDVIADVKAEVQHESERQLLAEPDEGDSVVVLGMGLDAMWQNDTHQGWLLWQNIMQAFDWDESQIVFFDTAHMASEEMMFSTMEEVIELGVDWVLTMDQEHPISELLQEGVQILSVPDIDSMLSDPYAKQAFYQSVVSITSHR